VNGLAQGKFDIRTDPATGERSVQRQAPGTPAGDITGLTVVRKSQAVPMLRLTDMVSEIRRIVSEAGR
jgi:hypothetical protein